MSSAYLSSGSLIRTNKWFLGVGFVGAPPISLREGLEGPVGLGGFARVVPPFEKRSYACLSRRISQRSTLGSGSVSLATGRSRLPCSFWEVLSQLASLFPGGDSFPTIRSVRRFSSLVSRSLRHKRPLRVPPTALRIVSPAFLRANELATRGSGSRGFVLACIYIPQRGGCSGNQV